MSAEWKTMRLDQLAQINPTRKVQKGSTVPFVEMAALPQRSRDIGMADVVSREAKGSGAHFQNGDTLLARITPCLENGKTAQVCCLEGNSVAEGSTEFIVLCGNDPADNNFIYYLCRDPSFRKYAIARMEGTSGRQRVSWQSIAAYEFAPPPPNERRAASRVLTALDDRIALLRETNATLEAIAQALFKSWFVDFDPVRAKQEGRAPEGMSDATAALFPDSFEESALGLVPKGWRVGTFANLIRLHKGSVNPGAQPDVTFQHFSLPAFDAGQMPVLELGSEIKSNKTTVPKDAVLLSKLNPHIPRIWLPSVVNKEAICSTEFLPFIPNGPATKAFVYCLLSAPDFSSSLCQLVTGTSNSHQRIKPDGVLSLPATIPTTEIASEFDAVTSLLFARLRANRQQTQTLATLRDTLLPRLISGQLRLPEAVAEIEEVTA